MNCREVQHHLFAGLDQTLAEAQRAALSAHVSECAACRRIHEDLTAVMMTWQTESDSVRIPDAKIEWQKLRREYHRQPEPARRSLTAWMALPVAAAAAIAVGLFVSPGTQPSAPPANVIAKATAAVAPQTGSTDGSSTVVFVDDKSGWTFVWTTDNGSDGQHI